jgi:hypothetical protein
MKKLTSFSILVSLVASGAFAGGLAPVVVEDEPVIDTKPSSSVSPLLVLVLLVLIGV